MNKRPIKADYYFKEFRWYRKIRKCTWYHHEFTPDAIELSPNFTGTWWALYGYQNRYSKVIEVEQFKTKTR